MKKALILSAMVLMSFVANAQTNQEPEKKKGSKTDSTHAGNQQKSISEKGISGKSTSNSKKEANASDKKEEKAEENKKEGKKPE